MDFAHICLDRLRWSPVIKKKSNCSYGSEKPRFQVPQTTIKLVPSPRFENAFDVSVEDVIFPEAFLEFIDGVRASAYTSIYDDLAHKSFYSPWNRLTMFDDGLVFDSSGTIVKDANIQKGYHTASLLVQLDGLWISDMSWGLRLRLVQIKLHEQHVKPLEPEPPVHILVEGREVPQGKEVSCKPYLFVADDG